MYLCHLKTSIATNKQTTVNTLLHNLDQHEIENRIFTIRDMQVMLDSH